MTTYLTIKLDIIFSHQEYIQVSIVDTTQKIFNIASTSIQHTFYTALKIFDTVFL
ncbi:hypothetical protein EHF_0176 [Ehrlichia japonica]|uniref:Uncharacterized protein n=1 Tax=Ehrlichia japonica TaxID=391036 RepID=X5GAT1_9RICK|nr:hypothetical protein EHF_0176 [Ehrlichia japonica]